MAIPRSEEIKDLAIKYSKQQLAQLAQRGEVDPTTAIMAGMMRDRIVQSEMIQQMPDTTVFQDTFTPKQDMASAAMGPPQDQLAQMRAPVEGQPQMAMMAQGGLASLDVPDDMVPDEYAGGGIIAFANGGTPIDYTQFGELGEELKRQEELRRMFLGENEALKAEREGMDAAKDEQRAMRLIEAGLGIAGGQSPYALQNIATGALPAVKGYGEDVKTQRKRETELAGMDRAERAKVLEAATGAVQAREKLTPETIRAARALQDEAREAGKKVPTLTQAVKMLERTTGTATLESARLNALSKRAAARIEAMNALTMNPKYNEAVKKGDADTVRRLEREARAKVDVQFAEFLEPGVEPEAAPTAAPARAKPTLGKFLEAARKANPGVSDGELTKYYNQKYGQ
jgi:hypothetical protein